MPTKAQQDGENTAPKTAERKAANGQRSNIKPVRWDDCGMTTSFANVVNVIHTREEFMLVFGLNKSVNLSEAEEMVVEINQQVMLTPHAAKRLLLLLQNRIGNYEARFGEISLG